MLVELMTECSLIIADSPITAHSSITVGSLSVSRCDPVMMVAKAKCGAVADRWLTGQVSVLPWWCTDGTLLAFGVTPDD
eukprot:IDg17173t1